MSPHSSRLRNGAPRSEARRWLMALALPGATAVLLSSCSSPPSSELVVVISTDLAIPADIDWLDWTLVRPAHPDEHGSLALSSFDSLPGTLAIVSDKGGGEPIQIELDARSGGATGDVRVHREARLTMPVGEKVLKMPLTWLCSDVNLPAGCAADQTCQAGRCVDSAVSAPFADFVPEAPAACFDVLDCALKGTYRAATPNRDTTTGDCIIDNALPQTPFNVALELNPATVGNAGVCAPGSDGNCFVPLNQDDTPDGWQLVQNAQGQTVVRLPIGVCDALHDDAVLTVALTHNDCVTKTSDIPACAATQSCVVSSSSCPDGFADDWQGYSCSGPAVPSDSDSSLKYCGISDSDPELPPLVRGHFCCTAGQSTPDTPLLIDDMSDGSLIKYPPPANQFPGSWFTASDDTQRPLSTPQAPGSLFTYTDIPTVKPSGEPSFDRAACFEMRQGFSGYYALEGFSFATDGAKSIALDVSQYSGISFWAMVKGLGSDPPPTIGAYFPNGDTDTEHNSTCIRKDEVPGDTAGKSNCSHFRALLPVTSSWTKINVLWADLSQDPTFGMQFPSFNENVYSVDFEALGANPTMLTPAFEFCVSQIYFIQ